MFINAVVLDILQLFKLFTVFGNYEQCLCEHLCLSLLMHVYIIFFMVYTLNCRIDPVTTKPAHIPLLLRAPPVAPAYPTGNAKVFAVAQGSPLYVGLYNPYICVCFSL